MATQESEGLLSPLARSVRLRKAAALIPRDSLVVDLAAGAGYLRDLLPPGCRYCGVDRLVPPVVRRFDAFFCEELTDPEVFERLARELPGPADVVTVLAFLEHVKEPARVLAGLKRILKESGRVIATTPHPVSRKLHDSLARLYLCSRSGATEHEEFLGREELGRVATEAGYALVSYRRFLIGLNQLVELRPLRVGS